MKPALYRPLGKGLKRTLSVFTADAAHNESLEIQAYSTINTVRSEKEHVQRNRWTIGTDTKPFLDGFRRGYGQNRLRD